jgi:signal peptidase II
VQTAGGAALTHHEKTLDAGGTGADGTPPPVAIDPARRTRAVRLFVAVALGIIAMDQVVKHLTVSILAHRDPVRLLGGAVYLVYVRNSGAAFSFAQNYTFVFPVIATLVAAWIIWMSRRMASLPWAVALGLVLGGALGNLVDRVFRAPGPFVGHADSALSIGVALAVLLEFSGRRRDGTRSVKNE